jgi:hypothetical protein
MPGYEPIIIEGVTEKSVKKSVWKYANPPGSMYDDKGRENGNKTEREKAPIIEQVRKGKRKE